MNMHCTSCVLKWLFLLCYRAAHTILCVHVHVSDYKKHDILLVLLYVQQSQQAHYPVWMSAW